MPAGTPVPALAVARQTAGSTGRGIACALAAWLLFACMDAGSKLLAEQYAIIQILWVRFLSLLAVSGWLAARHGSRGLITRRFWLQSLRSLMLMVEIGLFILTITVLPLADAHAILAISPLIVTALSVPLLKERVGWRRWSAVGAGFAGVLIVIRPGFGEVPWQLALPLVTAACFALYQILTRLISVDPDETPFVMLFYLAWVGAAVTTLIGPFYWQPVAAADWPWLIAIGALGAIGHLILIRALVIAPASLIAPFTYSQIVWALIAGYLVFGDVPDVWMLIGCTVIVASGLFVFYREAVLGKR
jgi:drug/metabolite transporter (DMT)-like permease